MIPSARAEIGEPVPGEHALDGHDEIVPVGGDRFEESLGARPDAPVQPHLASLVEDAEVEGACVQIDAAVRDDPYRFTSSPFMTPGGGSIIFRLFFETVEEDQMVGYGEASADAGTTWRRVYNQFLRRVNQDSLSTVRSKRHLLLSRLRLAAFQRWALVACLLAAERATRADPMAAPRES